MARIDLINTTCLDYLTALNYFDDVGKSIWIRFQQLVNYLPPPVIMYHTLSTAADSPQLAYFVNRHKDPTFKYTLMYQLLLNPTLDSYDKQLALYATAAKHYCSQGIHDPELDKIFKDRLPIYLKMTSDKISQYITDTY